MPTQKEWDSRFLRIAEEVAFWSKDPVYKHGSVIVKDRKILSTGYNGFPKGMPDHEHLLNDREQKRVLMIHAEQNAIYNATTDLQGSTLYLAGWHRTVIGEDLFTVEKKGLSPCIGCANGIIQVGIVRVVLPENTMDSVAKYGDDAPYCLESALSNLRAANLEVDYI